MAQLPRRKFVSSKEREAFSRTWRGRYLQKMKSNSLVYFGLPFFTMMLVGTYFAAQFSTIKFEESDRRVQEIPSQRSLEGVKKRKVDMKEEYYRLQHMDLDNWEQKRVKRLPGESENKW